MDHNYLKKKKQYKSTFSSPKNSLKDHSSSEHLSFSHSNSNIQKKPPHRYFFFQNRFTRQCFLAALFLFLLSIVILIILFISRIFSTINTISLSPQSENQNFISNTTTVLKPLLSSSRIPLRGEEDGRTNILLLGRSGQDYAGTNLTDTIMILSIDTKERRVGFISLPRDLYVTVPDTHYSTKINSVLQYGLSNNLDTKPIISVIEEITKLPIHYHMIVDFEGFIDVVNTLGGIKVTVPNDIYDTRYPGPHYSYETFALSKGLQTLDGATALKYVRFRHDAEGDFGRARRQQQVLHAIRNNILSTHTILNLSVIESLFDAAAEHVRTDLTLEIFASLVYYGKTVDTQNIASIVIDAWRPESLLRVSHVFINTKPLFILLPRVGNYSEIQEHALHLFDLEKLKRRHENIKSEHAKIRIINKSGDKALPQRIKKLLLDDLNFEDVTLDTSLTNSSIIKTSTVYDNTKDGAPFSLDELLEKLNIPLTNDTYNNPDDKTQVTNALILILGSDLVNIYSFSEDNIKDLED